MPAYTYIIDIMYQEWEQNKYPSSVDVGLDVDKLDRTMLIYFLLFFLNLFLPRVGVI